MNINNLISNKGLTGYLFLFGRKKEIQCSLYEVNESNNTATIITGKGLDIYNELISQGSDTSDFFSNIEYVKVFNIADIKDFMTDKSLIPIQKA
jgi:hypothetical protein